MNTESKLNIDRSEQEKFDAIASGWWDPDGPFRPLHDLNPARLKFVTDRAELDGARAIDVGCGGGILAEGLAELASRFGDRLSFAKRFIPSRIGSRKNAVSTFSNGSG